MKQTFTVKITVDDDMSKAGQSTTDNREGSTLYKIDIHPPRHDQVGTTAEILAHELGHVVATVVKTDASENDPRYLAAKNNIADMWMTVAMNWGVSSREKKDMLAAESEAWDFAGMMTKVRPEAKEFALETYRNARERNI